MQALAALLGPDGLLHDAESCRRYATPARGPAGLASMVLRPRDTAQVSAAVAHCLQAGIRLVVQSGNTGLVGGSVPDAGGSQAVLSLERLHAPAAVDAADRTVTVGAGTRLSALNQQLEPFGLFLPIDLGADPMIGGMVATNTGGARFLRYGGMRRHVLGLELVLPDAQGTVLRLGRGLRKDNAGIDLLQLAIGSCGAFGIVTAATLEVQRLPQQRAAALLVPAGDDAVLALLQQFETAAGEYLTAFEFLSGAAMACAFAHVPNLRNPFAGGAVPERAVLVELTRSWAPRDGEAGLEQVLQTALEAQFEAGLLDDALVGAPQALWALRHALSEGVRAAGTLVGFDLSLRRGRVAAFRAEASRLLAAEFSEFRICDFGHVADGGLHFNLVGPRDVAPSRVAALRERIATLAVDGYGGSFSGEHGIGPMNQALYHRLTPAPVQHLAGAVQAAFGQAIGTARYGADVTAS